MSEFRTDPLSGHRVIVATNRAGRPHEFKRRADRPAHLVCPFCRGHERDTPEPIACYRPWQLVPGGFGEPSYAGGFPEPSYADSPDWQLRVIPNLYPALSDLEESAGSPPEANPPSLFLVQSGAGVHEVIVESPEHLVSYTQLSPAQAQLALLAYRDRLDLHSQNSRWRYAQVFKNVGAEAGASIEHIHSQVLVLPEIPTQVAQRVQSARAHYDRFGRCLLCQLLESERQAGERLVRETEHFLAYCPFASRFPYEISIAPKQHASRFESLSLAQLGELAQTLRFVLIALEACIANPAYNYAICNAPFDTGCHPYYHWHIEVFPRLTNLAGFELATGCYINPVSPESAAGRLRSVTVNGEEQGNYFDQKN